MSFKQDRLNGKPVGSLTGDGKEPKPMGRIGAYLKYKFNVSLREPVTIVSILALALFTYLIVVPIVFLLLSAGQLQLAEAGRGEGSPGDFTLFYFERVFLSPAAQDLFWEPLKNTIFVAVGAIIIALLVGGTIAWFLSRTNMYGRKWFATALIVPYMLPGWTFALAWNTIFRNRKAGGQLGWLEAVGINPPDWLAYGQFPITMILALHYAPFVILLFGNALRNMDTQLEDSSRILGAGRLMTMRRVILPLMKPSLMSATILVFAKAIGDFGVTYILGMPVKYNVLATSMYQAITTRQSGVAAVLTGAIILIGAITLMVDARMVREAKKFITIGAKGAMRRIQNLGKWRFAVTGYAGLVFVIAVAIPLSVLFLSTIMRRPANFSPENFTLDYWIGKDLDTVALPQGILLTPEFWSAAWNTVWIVGSAAIAAGLLGIVVGYVVVRSPIRFIGTAVRHITFLPYLVPGIAFAVAYLTLFAEPRGPIPALYGTGLILLLALMADQMPYASRAGISSMMQLGKDPEEAARVVGAGWWKRMTSVVIPIQKSSLASGVLLPFISGVKGLSLVVILAVPGTDLLTTYALRLIDYGYYQATNAVVLMVCAIAFFGTIFGQKLTKSNLGEGLQG